MGLFWGCKSFIERGVMMQSVMIEFVYMLYKYFLIHMSAVRSIVKVVLGDVCDPYEG